MSGEQVDYNDQLFWAGYSTMPSLPVTTIPIRIVIQVVCPWESISIGPYLEDKTTLAFARGSQQVREICSSTRVRLKENTC